MHWKTYTLNYLVMLLENISGHRLKVKVNPTIVRKNEIHLLCGDPTKIQACKGRLASYDLTDTLHWMLKEPL